jgi:hypothetical protein
VFIGYGDVSDIIFLELQHKSGLDYLLFIMMIIIIIIIISIISIPGKVIPWVVT